MSQDKSHTGADPRGSGVRCEVCWKAAAGDAMAYLAEVVWNHDKSHDA